MSVPDRRQLPPSVFRKLRTFAVDPGLTARFDTAPINEMTLTLPFEPLQPGPIGEYVAVIDKNKKGVRLHPPVDLDAPELIAQDGLAPSDGNPQFHQQMVYAVAMRTIRNFERALGRTVHWPPIQKKSGAQVYQRRLGIYPHYLAGANAYYDSAPGGLRFGSFVSGPETPFPGMSIFTCLSQDVIAHELSHALLSGMGIMFGGSERDSPALGQAFADLIPLFQHFWKSDVLAAQIAAIGGNLNERSALGAVALQFGQALGSRSQDGLRNALGHTDENGTWRPRIPDPRLYQTTEEPHDRGDILVGAVFEAFRKIYESRITDLRRLASRGTGIPAQGSLHPDLVNRLTDAASATAGRALDMCIRALDYLPAINMTFGDYLRAIITADHELDPADYQHHRVAFVEAFRSYGIFPSDVGTLSVDTLLWPAPVRADAASIVSKFIRKLAAKQGFWDLPRDREALWKTLNKWKQDLARLLRAAGKTGRKRLGPVRLAAPFEIVAFEPRQRVAFDRTFSAQWIVKIVQPPLSNKSPYPDASATPKLKGCTLVLDATNGQIKYQIEKPVRARRKPKGAQVRSLLAPTVTSQPPALRRVRVFAFDPSFGVSLETAGINEIILEIPWERDADGRSILGPGPIGEYVEVVDRDPASACSYAPVDLNDPRLLRDGLRPSESNPQFHQVMVYAVTMRTIRTFESALGRLALWSPRRSRVESKGQPTLSDDYVQRLRLYPHALREANAYYSPSKKAILFGYFPAAVDEGNNGSAPLTVFTCLSHDIVAHEVTHALLDGMHRRFREPSNPDVLAFHEAFADLVALFQHFSIPEVLRHQIAATRGDLSSQNRLGELAQQFGQAIGQRGALRSAIGKTDEKTGQWKPAVPSPEALRGATEPHDRGAILVAAVFEAFLTIYKVRVADLLRIASEGTGILPEGYLHPDLVNRLAEEAALSARHVLDMCIRALDYCPPVDLTFGDYLRAIVTADYDFNPVDETHRRVAFVEAFRRRGITPEGVRALSIEALLWRESANAPDEDEGVIADVVKKWTKDLATWSLTKSRRKLFDLMKQKRATLHGRLKKKFAAGVKIVGIDPALKFEVHSIRPSLRADWEGRPRFQWVIELTQRIPQYLEEIAPSQVEEPKPDYFFRGGCTLVVDAESGNVRYSIRKPLTERRKEQQRRYFLGQANENLAATYFGGVASEQNEPFAVLHRL